MNSISLGDICTIEKGKIGIKAATAGQYPLVTTAKSRASHNEYHFEGEAVCIPLVSATGHGHASINRLHYESGQFCVGSILAACIPKDNTKTSAKFLYLYLSLLKDRILVPLMQGSANVSLKIKDLKKVPVPDISLSEQASIVEQFENLEITQTKLLKELDSQLNNIQLLRQTILQEAVQGKLVPQDPNDVPASELLKKIQAEKEQLIKDKKIKNQKPLPPIKDDEIPYELPEGWVWCRWGELGANKDYAFKRGPFGSDLKKEFFVNSGYKVYEQRNAIYNDPTLGDYYIDSKKYSELKAFKVTAGDLIISCSGATLGRIGVIPEQHEDGIINQALLKISINTDVINKAYFIYLFKSDYLQSKILDFSKGSAIPNMVGLNILKNILLPLPPLQEQQLIVAKVDQLMQLCDELEAQVQQSKTDAEQLLQAVLREAFEGGGN